MLRKSLCLATVLLVFAAIEYQRITDLIPDGIRNEMPKKMVEELDKLSVQDLKALKNIALRWPEFRSIVKLQDVMKEESPRITYLLDNLIELFHEKVGDGIDSLPNTTHEFIDKAATIIRKGGNTIRTIYDYEKPEVKDNLREVFPQIMLLVENPSLKNVFFSYMCGSKSDGLILNGSAAYRGAFGAQRYGSRGSYYSRFRGRYG
ncbi:unnamed protein product [Bursaphelenchus xylophilus]|uniref:(pine wood nematode) hypothetical protein n=1 Tax=Bursaphelenchus xylophilus TaxID=6326 RepID=A0A1I7SVZ7_BURXY|nr:unnamed protein product [Bursaphelenchus xylophilus]CAG9098564.1 unnamed protein product [Bursaphelenchus xylophilus]